MENEKCSSPSNLLSYVPSLVITMYHMLHRSAHALQTAFYPPPHTHTANLLPEPRRAATHDLALAHELSVELGPVERKVNVEVDAVEGSLRGVHALKVLLEVFAREV
jgi:hypothetical protein